jgi:ankyrin repeat protein
LDNFKEILIHSIIKNAPLEIIEFILEKKKNINLNFEYKIGNINYVPLFSAIANNNFIIADKLIKNGANINYYSNLNKRFIIYDIYNKNKLNEKNLKYILNKNFYENICKNLIDNLIKKIRLIY